MSDDKRYIREKCGCVEVVELDARATTMVPCAAHFDADDFGHQTATSCPACDDDGGPCALCNRAFSQPVDNAAQPDERICEMVGCGRLGSDILHTDTEARRHSTHGADDYHAFVTSEWPGVSTDTERLDWLEAHSGELDKRLDGRWRVMWGYDPVAGYEKRCIRAATPRAAIDAAMESTRLSDTGSTEDTK